MALSHARRGELRARRDQFNQTSSYFQLVEWWRPFRYARRMANLADRIIAHYEKHATSWDRARQDAAWNDKVWHDRFASALPPGARLLDLGCGSGHPSCDIWPITVIA